MTVAYTPQFILAFKTYNSSKMSVGNIIHQLLISVLLFTFWAAFALLIVNPIYNADLPNYVMGKLCIWDYIAMIIALLGSFILTKFWGYPEVIVIDNHKKLVLNLSYAYFFGGYFLSAFIIAIWQFWIFSQKFL